ncbi:hypothetical protein BDN71DRAFT_1500763 [Pleurotus eryngii]|uniref:Uncharacterized protein n=1 Tax=Pleurotus eryngii TaxID=5323 RepID=A0A9P6A7R4_PLEER|nr:hypothetical protein BDN71DRAFT_1500763 [Pleurotus eryngii]
MSSHLGISAPASVIWFVPIGAPSDIRMHYQCPLSQRTSPWARPGLLVSPAPPLRTRLVYRKHNACAHRSKGVYSTVGTKDISTILTPAPSPRSYKDEPLLYNYHSSFEVAIGAYKATSPGSPPDARETPRTQYQASGLYRIVLKPLQLDDSLSPFEGKSSRGRSIWSYRPIARSWSHDNALTYQPMKMPPSIKKRKVKQIVDGVEKEVTIEVQVENNGKRLFNFPDKEYYARR